MSFLKKVWFGEFSLSFTFWVMCCLAPIPFFPAKYYLHKAGVFTHENMVIFLAGQAFLWLEWSFFAFITVALWNSSSNHLKRAGGSETEKAIWGQLGRVLAVASGILILGSFSNISGLTTLIFGRPMFIGLGGG
jgi:hypothetical protein